MIDEAEDIQDIDEDDVEYPSDDDKTIVAEYFQQSKKLIEEDLADVRATFHNNAAYYYDEAAACFYIRLPIGSVFFVLTHTFPFVLLINHRS